MIRRLLAVSCLVALAPLAVSAQRGQVTGLTGVVRDSTKAVLADVVLTVASPELIGGPQTARTDAEGRYRFHTLLPGTYVLTAAHVGFESASHSGIELLPGLTHTLDVTLRISPVSAAVDVRATVPAVDVRSSASQQVIERELLEHLPRESRSVSDYLALAPGVTNGTGGNVAFGGAAIANPIAMDGTNGTSPVQHAPQAAPVAYWLDSLQVVAVGANAEYAEYTTARLNLTTRSGSNRFAGLGEYSWTRRAWAKWNELLDWQNADAQLGGPIRRDRVWFFTGAEYYKNVYRVPAFAARPRAVDEPVADTRDRKMIGKLTTAPSRAVRLEGFMMRNRGTSVNGNARVGVLPEALGAFTNSQELQNVRLTWTLDDRTLVEAHYGRFRGANGQGPTSPDRYAGPAAHIDQATGVFSVNYQQVIDSSETVQSGRMSITRYLAPSRTGAHELKAGIEHERSQVEDDLRYPGGMIFFDRDGQPELVRQWGGAHYEPTHHRTSLYLRDSWQLGRVTIDPGVRLGFYDSSVPQPASETYSNHSISPRLGAAWDVSSDHRTVARAHYGWYHDAMSTRFYEFLDAFAETPTITARIIGPDQFEEVSRFGGPGRVPTIDPDVRHSYVEEFSAGVERELWPRVSVKAQYVRRNTRNTIGFVDNGTTWIPTSAVDPGPDGRQGTGDDGGPLTIYINDQSTLPALVMTNPSAAWRHHDGLQFVVSRRPANGWSYQASYSWGRTRGSFDNENGSNAANTDAGQSGHFANPNRAINATGRTVFDRPHDVRAFGTYHLTYWGGFRISGVYRLTSGNPWGRYVTSFDPRTGGAVLVEPVGTRAYPALHELDLRVEKTIPIGGARAASVFASVFNVTDHVVAARINQNSGSAFGQVTTYTQPRRFRVAVRVTF